MERLSGSVRSWAVLCDGPPADPPRGPPLNAATTTLIVVYLCTGLFEVANWQAEP